MKINFYLNVNLNEFEFYHHPPALPLLIIDSIGHSRILSISKYTGSNSVIIKFFISLHGEHQYQLLLPKVCFHNPA